MAFAVVDSSFVLSWGLEEAGFEAGLKVLTSVVRHGGSAPAPWATEVMEGLRKAVARERITLADVKDIAGRISKLRVGQDDATWAMACRGTFDLARRHKLSIYDSCYLELAVRTSHPLVTLDTKLRQAARLEKVFVLPQVS